MTESPYPGLRPFGRKDSKYFFGREEHIDQLVEKLGNTRFVSVFGPSGFGKSSLVRAGLFPALEKGFLAGRSRWQIVEMRPGNQPFVHLSKALTKKEDEVKPTRAILQKASLGINNWLDENSLPSGTFLLKKGYGRGFEVDLIFLLSF